MRPPFLCIALLALPSLAHAQGTLAPGGAPAQSMRSLHQIEPRSTIGAVGGSSSTIAITSPGSYVLLGDVSVASGHAITISSDHVTLDLNGFTLSSTASPAAGVGIYGGSPASSHVRIRNGCISGTGTVSGAGFSGAGFLTGIAGFAHSFVTDTTVSGVSLSGISLGANSRVLRSTVRHCGANGITATQVADCSVSACHRTGIRSPDNEQSLVVRSSSDSRTTGILATVVADSRAASSTATGIDTTIVRDSYGQASNGYGIKTTLALNCTGRTLLNTSGESAGLSADIAVNSYGSTAAPYSVGLSARLAALNCTGANTAAGQALEVTTGVAAFCRGNISGGSATGYYAIEALNAIGCTASGGTISAPKKSLGTP